MTSRVIKIDVDGVLLDYTRAFLKFAPQWVLSDFSTHPLKESKYEDLTQYDLSNLFSNTEHMLATMKHFHSSYEFAHLAPLARTVELEFLKNAGHKLHVITQLENIPHVRFNRLANLTHEYGSIFDKIQYTVAGQCKLDVIAEELDYEPYIIIEDNPKLLEKANATITDDLTRYGKTRITAYGVRHPYNAAVLETLPAIIVVDSFGEAVNLIVKEDFIDV